MAAIGSKLYLFGGRTGAPLSQRASSSSSSSSSHVNKPPAVVCLCSAQVAGMKTLKPCVTIVIVPRAVHVPAAHQSAAITVAKCCATRSWCNQLPFTVKQALQALSHIIALQLLLC
jgi:hypothetical protein